MYVKVRTIDGRLERGFDVSKLISIEDLKSRVSKAFEVNEKLQRLFFWDKQLENGYIIFHYGVGLGDVLELLVQMPEEVESPTKASTSFDSSYKPDGVQESKENAEQALMETHCPWCEVGDAMDCLDCLYSAWFEATVLKILSEGSQSSTKLFY